MVFYGDHFNHVFEVTERRCERDETVRRSGEERFCEHNAVIIGIEGKVAYVGLHQILKEVSAKGEIRLIVTLSPGHLQQHGGVVDVRGNVAIDGTILSMGDPGWGIEAAGIGTNIGYSDENGEGSIPTTGGTISIAPSADRLLPMGIRTRTLLLRHLAHIRSSSTAGS